MTPCDHTSVGMLIRNGDKLLLIERRNPPYGFAPPAGHVDEHGSFEDAAIAEVQEEVGLAVKNLHLVAESRRENICRRPGGDWHHWKVYETKTEGKISASPSETKHSGWYDPAEVQKLAERLVRYQAGTVSESDWQAAPGLEPVWFDWFVQLGIIPANLNA